VLPAESIKRLQAELIQNVIAFGSKITELALPLRLGICSIISAQAVSLLNSQLVELVQKLLKTKEEF